MGSPLRTYNMRNHHAYTQHTAFKPHILHLIHYVEPNILMSLHTSKVQNHNVSTYPNTNSPCAHLFILIIFDPISHIYAVHTQRKVYHSMNLHTYTVNFATSSNLQEIL